MGEKSALDRLPATLQNLQGKPQAQLGEHRIGPHRLGLLALHRARLILGRTPGKNALKLFISHAKADGVFFADALNSAVKQVPELELDLDGIAPGEAVDLIAARLEAAGFGNYMIEVGGEVRAQGRNAAGLPWRIGVERPDESGRSVARVLHIDGMSVSTSGDYRDYFEAGGTHYGHTIDPVTGRPIAHALASVTILRPLAAEADALATALNVLGPQAGWELAEAQGWPALLIERTAGGYRQLETVAFSR